MVVVLVAVIFMEHSWAVVSVAAVVADDEK
jgi:hypothetical protein